MKRMVKLSLAGLLGLAVVLLARQGGIGAEEKYPHVDAAIGYVVDPAWPQIPTGVKWAELSGVAVDKNDNVYVVTRANPPVQVYDTAGKFIRSWGEDTIKTPHQIKIDTDGNVWISDIGYHTVMKFTPQGKLLLTIGTKGELGRDKTHLNMPTDMAVTPKGDVFVSDGYGNARVVHFDPTGKYVKEWGELGSKPGQFSIPHAICIDSRGRLYVADRNNVRIQVFDQDGKLLSVWANVVTPWGFWVTPKDEIWVCGSSPMRWRKEDSTLGCPPKDQVFMKFNGDGKLLQLWTVPKGADGFEKPGELNWVHCIAEDSKGNLYAGDIKGKKAQKFVRQD
jgi:DNA-binding beta-propeller fold protein YncE